MFYNLKIAIRNLQRNGLYSWINVIGLAVGLTACILIALWVQDEWSFDRFHRNAKNLYLTYAVMNGNQYWNGTPAPLALHAKAMNPDVAEACRVSDYQTGYLDYGNQKFQAFKGLAVDSSFLQLFDFPLLDGDSRTPFPDDLSMIVSESMAKALFGNEHPVGKTLRTADSLLLHITGVAKDAPKNTALPFDYLVPFDILQRTFKGNGAWKFIRDDWGSYHYRIFFLLREGSDPAQVAANLSEMVTTLRNDNAFKYEFILQPLTEMHLYAANGEPQGMKTVRMLGLITVLILLIACINYVNLVTSRAAKRSREMAVRKIMGAHKSTLFRQLMRETAVLLAVALAAATVLIYLLMPVFNDLTGKTMAFHFSNPAVWQIYGLMALSVLLAAGLYPAFILSSFRPMAIFRPRASATKRGKLLRKTLVVLQFAVSFALIAATFCIHAQMRFMREKDLGYTKENVFKMQARAMVSHYEAVRNELLENKEILGVTGSNSYWRMIGSSRGGTFWNGKPDDFNPVFDYAWVQPDFCEVMNIALLEGEPLSPRDTLALLINETAAKIMGMENPVGQPFYLNRGDKQAYTIRGVVKDFNYAPLNEPVMPLLLVRNRWGSHAFYIKTTGAGAQSAIATAERLWKQYNPDYEFTYAFLDDEFDRLYREDLRMGKLLTLFALIAIFISCIGLFGLVAYTAEAKTKEIGIRKVLGASVRGIVAMLSTDFLRLVGIAILLAFPVVYYWLGRLLENYAYHIPLGWWLFAAAALITVALTLLTVGFKAYRAATANPVHAIQSE
jgi:ABC-type antimicrobial peptide transport system permease subunit